MIVFEQAAHNFAVAQGASGDKESLPSCGREYICKKMLALPSSSPRLVDTVRCVTKQDPTLHTNLLLAYLPACLPG